MKMIYVIFTVFLAVNVFAHPIDQTQSDYEAEERIADILSTGDLQSALKQKKALICKIIARLEKAKLEAKTTKNDIHSFNHYIEKFDYQLHTIDSRPKIAFHPRELPMLFDSPSAYLKQRTAFRQGYTLGFFEVWCGDPRAYIDGSGIIYESAARGRAMGRNDAEKRLEKTEQNAADNF